jgi:hypothetical protein
LPAVVISGPTNARPLGAARGQGIRARRMSICVLHAGQIGRRIPSFKRLSRRRTMAICAA